MYQYWILVCQFAKSVCTGKKGILRLSAIVLAILSGAAQFATVAAGTFELQPGPGNGKDIWTTSVYSYSGAGGGPGGGLDNERLVVGGWGDRYYSLLEFDISSAPAQATSATLQLFDYGLNGGSLGTTGMYLDRITEYWDWKTQGTGSDHERLWWADRPSATQLATLGAPSVGEWYDIDVTALYNSWQDGTYDNYGLQLRPISTANRFNLFYSSDYLDDPSLRPKLVVNYATPTPPADTPIAFNLPVASENRVDLNTEVNGQAWDGSTDTDHQGGGFYSLDFDTVGGETAEVVAASDGEIVRVRYDAQRSWAPSDPQPYNKTTVTVAHPDLSQPGQFIFTEYRHFELSDNMRSLISACESQGKYNSVSGDISGCSSSLTNVNAKEPLGTINGVTGEWLHFQAKQSESLANYGQGLSEEGLDKLENATVGGRLFKDFQLHRSDGTLLPEGEALSRGTQLYGQSLPVLPTTSDKNDPAYKFNIVVGDLGVGLAQPIYIDPVIAIGYDYEVLSGPLISTVVLPSIGDDEFELWLFDPSLDDYIFEDIILADIPFSFGPVGVDRFRILGIEPSAMLDPDDPTAFITGLTFNGPGEVNVTMTPITAEVPEPASILLFGIGLAGIGFANRKQRAARINTV